MISPDITSNIQCLRWCKTEYAACTPCFIESFCIKKIAKVKWTKGCRRTLFCSVQFPVYLGVYTHTHTHTHTLFNLDNLGTGVSCQSFSQSLKIVSNYSITSYQFYDPVLSNCFHGLSVSVSEFSSAVEAFYCLPILHCLAAAIGYTPHCTTKYRMKIRDDQWQSRQG